MSSYSRIVFVGAFAAGIVVTSYFVRRRLRSSTTHSSHEITTHTRHMLSCFAARSTPASTIASAPASVKTLIPCSEEDCDTILLNANVIERQTVVGLDVEWYTPPKSTTLKPKTKDNSTPRQHSGRVAVVQLSTNEWTLVVPVLRFNQFPDELRRILESDQVIKVGVGIRTDVMKLLQDWQVHCAACVNVQRLAAAVNGDVPEPPNMALARAGEEEEEVAKVEAVSIGGGGGRDGSKDVTVLTKAAINETARGATGEVEVQGEEDVTVSTETSSKLTIEVVAGEEEDNNDDGEVEEEEEEEEEEETTSGSVSEQGEGHSEAVGRNDKGRTETKDTEPRRPIPQGLSLKKLLLKRFGVVLDKTLARSNWANMHCLTDEQVQYAALDAAASRALFVAYWRDLITLDTISSATTTTSDPACLTTSLLDSMDDCGDMARDVLQPWFEVVRVGKQKENSIACNSIGCVIAHHQGGHHGSDSSNRATLRLEQSKHRAQAKADAAATKEYKKHRFERFSKWASRKSQLYQNIPLMAPDGVTVAMIPTKKLKWYISRDLADVVLFNAEDSADLSQHKLVKDVNTLLESYGEEEGELPQNIGVRLRFEPKGRTHAGQSQGQEFYLTDKKNQCVVCASTDNLVKHYVVPHEFRKFFPIEFKNRSSHDIVLMCTKCWDEYMRKKNKFKIQLGLEYGVTQLTNKAKFVTDNIAIDAKRAAGALLLRKRTNGGRTRGVGAKKQPDGAEKGRVVDGSGNGYIDGLDGNGSVADVTNINKNQIQTKVKLIPVTRIRELANKVLLALVERRCFLIEQGGLDDADVDLLVTSLSPIDDKEEEGNDRFLQITRADNVQDSLARMSLVNCKVPREGFVPAGKRLVDRMLAGLDAQSKNMEETNVAVGGNIGSIRGGETDIHVQRTRCQKFVERWRWHFVHHTQAKHLPTGWSIEFEVELNPLG